MDVSRQSVTNIIVGTLNLHYESDFSVKGLNTRPKQKVAQNANFNHDASGSQRAKARGYASQLN